jgi:phage shock protein A
MFRRFWRWFTGLFHRAMDNLEDPDIMLDQARREMQEGLVQNRERAVMAITQKNRLQAELEVATKRSQELEAKAVMALKQGNRDLARQFIREKAGNDQVMTSLQASYDQAVQAVDQVKLAVKRQEEEVRRKTAEALAMKAQWKQAQIQNSITKALEGLTFENQFETFGAAAEKIRNAQAEAAARQEMLGSSLQGKIMQMEDQAIDYQAEEELQKLEQKLGLNQPAAPTAEEASQQVAVGDGGNPGGATPGAPGTPPAPDVPASELEKQLEELEKRVNPGT